MITEGTVGVILVVLHSTHLTEEPIYGAAAKALDLRLRVCPASSHPLRSWVRVFSHGLVESNSSSPVLKRNILLAYSCRIFSTTYMNGRGTSLVAQMVKKLPARQETQVPSLGREDPLEKRMVTYSSILACRLPWTEKPGRLQVMGSQRV